MSSSHIPLKKEVLHNKPADQAESQHGRHNSPTDRSSMNWSSELSSQLSTKSSTKSSSQSSIQPLHHSAPREKAQQVMAECMTIPMKVFDSWWSQYGKPSATLKEQVLYLTQHYQIDPLLGDVTILYQSGRWIPHITMDGWMKIINQHPAFCGIDFQEAQELIDGVPQWISCTIYRQDRVIPITVREYYLELKQESSLWSEIPRRLLRFRSMQQCARLALSLSTPEFSMQTLVDTKPSGNMASPNSSGESPELTQVEKIKTKILKDSLSNPAEII